MHSRAIIPFAAALGLALAVAAPALAGDVTIPHAFASGTKAVAQEVNDNFDAVETAVDDNAARLAALEGLVATLQSDLAAANATIGSLLADLAAVQGNSVLALDGELTRDTDDFGRPRALFSGVNVQVVNGVDQATPNGTGNLIVGFDAERFDPLLPNCAAGEFPTQVECEAQGEVFALNHKSGSHNLVVGGRHNYSRTGGVVFGDGNTINRDGATILAGRTNVASGPFANVSGGLSNTASGNFSSVTGGVNNTAEGAGGSVSGGNGNVASGSFAHIAGGEDNVASGSSASVSGGRDNAAAGTRAVVSGGNARVAIGTEDWVAGSLFEDN